MVMIYNHVRQLLLMLTTTTIYPKYCYGQPLDNARDSLETNYQINPMISTRLTRVRGKDNNSYDLLHIVVRNSNPGNKVAFTLDRLKSILSYNRFHGSKLNVFRPSSGALGNALRDLYEYFFLFFTNMDQWIV
jgi:hypothetical protein